MDKVLSISVACYNLGEMIVDNIKSFCDSSVADKIELIITDDGSKDNSVQIVEEYIKKYPNTIKLIKKENQGPGSTVNSGIKNATGKYFRMVDGDDWVDTKNLELWVSELEKSDADMFVTPYCVFDNSSKQVIETTKYDIESGKLLNFDAVYKKLPNQMHAMTFKTQILKDNNILLDNCFYTDVEYLLYPIPFVKAVEYFDKPIYMYRVAQANQSVSPQSMIKNIAQHELVFSNVTQFYIKHENNLTLGQKEYIAERVASMADVQLTTYLCFENAKQSKTIVKKFFKALKQKNATIYNKFKKGKKCKLLRYSCFMLYSFVRKKVKKIRQG